MSIYDEVTFKSKYEVDNKQLPICLEDKTLIKNFENEFIQTFKDGRTSDIKDMMHLKSEDEKKKFDFIFREQQYVDEEFFKNKTTYVFDKLNEDKDKISYLIKYIEYCYGSVIGKEEFKKVFKEFSYGSSGSSSTSSLNSSFLKDDEDFENLIYFNFKKFQINLKDEKDRNLFREFLTSGISKNVNVNTSNNNKNVEIEKPRKRDTNELNEASNKLLLKN